MQAIATMSFFVPQALRSGASRARAKDQPSSNQAALGAMRQMSRVLAVFNDQNNKLLLDCKTSLNEYKDGLLFTGEEVVENCRPFLRPSNFVIACRPDKNYRWRFYYVNRVSGSVLDPTTYLKLVMDSPGDMPLPVMSTESFNVLYNAQQPIDLDLFELDFFMLERLSKPFSRALQFALRHRLKRYLKIHD